MNRSNKHTEGNDVYTLKALHSSQGVSFHKLHSALGGERGLTQKCLMAKAGFVGRTCSEEDVRIQGI